LEKAILSEIGFKLINANHSANNFILEKIEKPKEEITTTNADSTEYKSSNFSEKQKKFIETIKLAKSKKAKDDFEMGTILYERDKSLSQILGLSGLVENWIGVVEKKGADANGRGELTINIESKNNKGKTKTDFRVSNLGIVIINFYTGQWDDGLIEPDTDLYDLMKIINEGDKIRFSGNFVYKQDYLEGKSKTDIFESITFFSKTIQLKLPIFGFVFTKLNRH